MKKEDIDIIKTLAWMNDEQKAVWKGLTEAQIAELMKQDMEPRLAAVDALIKSQESKETPVEKGDDETMELNGQTIAKSEIGATAFMILKGQNSQMEKLEKKLQASEDFAKEERQKRINKELADEAQSRWPNLPGTAVEKAETLKMIKGLPEEAQEAQFRMLDAGNASASSMFKEFGGSGTPDGSSPTEKLDKLAKSYSAENKVSYAKAYDAVLQTPEGQKLYEKAL